MPDKNFKNENETIKNHLCHVPICDKKGNVVGYKVVFSNGMTLFAEKRAAARAAEAAEEQRLIPRTSGRRRV